MDDVPIATGIKRVGGWVKHNCLLLILVFVFLASCSAAICYERFYKEVVFSVDDGQEVVVTTWASTVEEALSETEIRLYSRDEIYPSLETPLEKEMKVTIKRAFPVHVAISDDQVTHWTTKSSVREIIQNLDIVLGIEDEVEPSLSSLVDKETTINIVRVEREYVVEEVELAYSVVRRGNSSLDRGSTRTVQRGKPGLREDTWEIVYRDGEEIGREVISSEIVQPKQDEIIEVGENSVLSRDGYTMNYNRALTVTALAYCNCAQCTGSEGGSARTSIGIPAVPGSGTRANPHIIAVDSGVIPLRSKVYIDGFGVAVAADTGSAIRGNKIDILMDSHGKALAFGRKRLKIYILDSIR
ncbi:3D domain-containing protein [Candidatus Contubernalis alkaliaceticus]|uniref:3D domain-containing protein n=1 Tax=Candidatus Contubernalis alkaliaceticus TaxID=338645 RepID=UPI001F4BD087|nr:3D domain-containing protein [Candidatus Contubernalis alkalaceticus]UNC90682.1 G5 domain-containing protein [Candidatus Contubernalis alkalaceticus]